MLNIRLAIEGGATASRAGLYTQHGELIGEAAGGPSNPVAYGLSQSLVVLVRLARQAIAASKIPLAPGAIETVSAGISGAGAIHLRDRIAEVLAVRLQAQRAIVCDDLRPVMYANAGQNPAVLVVAGTGSSVLVQVAADRQGLIGGRGPVFGEPGSAYGLAVAALRAAAASIDELGPETQLSQTLMDSLKLDSFALLPAWTGKAAKADIAALARAVVETADAGDAVAQQLIEEQARELARLASVGIRHLPRSAPLVLVHGGLFENVARFRKAFEAAVQQSRPGIALTVPRFRGHAAVAKVADAAVLPEAYYSIFSPSADAGHGGEPPLTERIDESAPAIDGLSSLGIAERMSNEDLQAVQAVRAEHAAIAEAIDAAADALRKGGRIIYVGAGTSGRLGVLDASECPATFGVAPSRVVAIIAGGDRALRESVEGAEDEASQGVVDLAAIQPPCGPNDFVVGIAASGSTPYTLSALKEATRLHARTALLCCNPDASGGADIVIAMPTGPEALAGSTRLKAGTATKMALNMISTGAMALAGYVYEGRMIGVRPVNNKLRDRALRIVADLSAIDIKEAQPLLTKAGGSIPVAVVMARQNVDAQTARKRLSEAGGILRDALAHS